MIPISITTWTCGRTDACYSVNTRSIYVYEAHSSSLLLADPKVISHRFLQKTVQCVRDPECYLKFSKYNIKLQEGEDEELPERMKCNENLALFLWNSIKLEMEYVRDTSLILLFFRILQDYCIPSAYYFHDIFNVNDMFDANRCLTFIARHFIMNLKILRFFLITFKYISVPYVKQKTLCSSLRGGCICTRRLAGFQRCIRTD